MKILSKIIENFDKNAVLSSIFDKEEVREGLVNYYNYNMEVRRNALIEALASRAQK
jgi:hypothetical protein